MIALVLHLALFPLVQPVAVWVYGQAGQTVDAPPRWATYLSLAVYLAAAVAIAAHAFTD
jgi:hypothetical protein